ncbi:MAG: HD domain-containing protein [Deltaproteobacteria bacterium]|nr:HD domain-containing protein [Deltaproteobacteria bacterium]MBW2051241.1 HD domain-containing protein [Deltaproteobacteria bacterium]MBW2141162.1 HD domain-containing protein [Deltaproteobacteria bacterium]MBW2322650.1 HD domain-containing protein [Deltaproteobacteria bacterium]
MSIPRIEEQINFIIEIDKLTSVFRQSYLINEDRSENSAEHSWHVATMALILSEYAEEEVDQFRVIKILLVHDIVEIDAGDTFCYDEIGVQNQMEREKRAGDRIFGLLPEDQAREIFELWQEYEAHESPESKFAGALDRLMPLLHNYHTNGKSWRKHGINRDQVITRNASIREGSEALWAYALSIIDKAVAKGYLAAS